MPAIDTSSSLSSLHYSTDHTIDVAFEDAAFDDTELPLRFPRNHAAEHVDEDRTLVLVIPPTPIAPSGGVARTPETGQRRIYDVRAWLSVPTPVALEGTWELTVEDVVGSEHTLAGRFTIRSLLFDADIDANDLADQLAPIHLVTFRRGMLTMVEAASPLAIDIVSRLARALGGIPTSPTDSIQISLVAFG
jgi:hypothetical protein